MTPQEKLQALKAKAKAAKEPEPQTEIEIGGISFKGGKIFVILTALSTAGGGLWGAFEFYKDYMDMKEQIQSYVAPDLSGFQEQLSVMEERMATIDITVEEARNYTRDAKTDLRKDIDRIEAVVEKTEDRTKEVQTEAFDAIRAMEKQTRELLDNAEQRFDNKRDALDLDTERKLKDLEERMNNTIQRALDNPLAN